MKKCLKYSVLSLLAAASTIAASVPAAYADKVPETATAQSSEPAKVASKEEVIYANLGSMGEIGEIYAVNIFNISEEGRIADYGDYTGLKNLTDTEQLAYSGGIVSTHVPDGRFYYQGTLKDKALPWDIKADYYLNGEKITPDRLAGSDGRLELKLLTSRNEQQEASFYEHYLLQISVTLNTGLAENIAAEGASIANSGKNRILSFTVMPDTDGNIDIKADVTRFEMDSIMISAIPFSAAFQLPDTSDTTGQLTSLVDAVAQLNEGIDELKGGTAGLNSGAAAIEDGSSRFKAGMKTLNAGSGDLTDASAKILNALAYLRSNLEENLDQPDLTALEELSKAIAQLTDGLGQISDGLVQLNTGYSEALTALENAVASIPEAAVPQEELQELMLHNPDSKSLGLLIDYYKAAQTVKATYSMVSEAFHAVQAKLPVFAASLDTMTGSLKEAAGKLEISSEEPDIGASLSGLAEGIGAIAENYKSFDAGLKDYTKGVSELYSRYAKLDSGIDSLADGTEELSQGTKELAAGSAQLSKETGKIPGQIEQAIDEMTAPYDNSDYVPVSFLSENNKQISLVQFVMKTQKLEIKEVKQPDTSERKQENFWTRLKDLFKF